MKKSKVGLLLICSVLAMGIASFVCNDKVANDVRADDVIESVFMDFGYKKTVPSYYGNYYLPEDWWFSPVMQQNKTDPYNPYLDYDETHLLSPEPFHVSTDKFLMDAINVDMDGTTLNYKSYFNALSFSTTADNYYDATEIYMFFNSNYRTGPYNSFTINCACGNLDLKKEDITSLSICVEIYNEDQELIPIRSPKYGGNTFNVITELGGANTMTSLAAPIKSTSVRFMYIKFFGETKSGDPLYLYLDSLSLNACPVTKTRLNKETYSYSNAISSSDFAYCLNNSYLPESSFTSLIVHNISNGQSFTTPFNQSYSASYFSDGSNLVLIKGALSYSGSSYSFYAVAHVPGDKFKSPEPTPLEQAKKYAEDFNDKLGAVCLDVGGITSAQALITAWTNQKAAYESLSNDAKGYFAKNNPTTPTDNVIIICVAKYDAALTKNYLILVNHFEPVDPDFMSRLTEEQKTALLNANPSSLFNGNGNNQSATVINSIVVAIVCISPLILAAGAIVLYLRKKKDN